MNVAIKRDNFKCRLSHSQVSLCSDTPWIVECIIDRNTFHFPPLPNYQLLCIWFIGIIPNSFALSRSMPNLIILILQFIFWGRLGLNKDHLTSYSGVKGYRSYMIDFDRQGTERVKKRGVRMQKLEIKIFFSDMIHPIHLHVTVNVFFRHFH